MTSLWELVIKRALNRSDFKVEPSLIRRALLEAGWQDLTVSARHMLAVADQQLARYPGPIRWMEGFRP